MSKCIGSRSDVQREIEKYIIDKVREELGNVELTSNLDICMTAEGKSLIRPDFFSESEKIIGEIHAHEGRLKSAQQNKIASDVLKMILYDKFRGCIFKKYLVVCGKEEYKQLKGESYLAEAIREYKITLLYVEIPEKSRKRLKEAMRNQNLIAEAK